MVLHPDIAKKAQAELDRVVGDERLPVLADRPSLPYLNALVLEVFRWHAVAPAGMLIPFVLSKSNLGHAQVCRIFATTMIFSKVISFLKGQWLSPISGIYYNFLASLWN